MKKDDLIYIEHILHNLSKVLEYLNDVGYNHFLENEEKQDAVIRKIEVVGEAAKHLSPEFIAKYPHIPWRAIAGMRDKLIHGYFNVDLDTVWDTATQDIPGLIPRIQSIFKEFQ